MYSLTYVPTFLACLSVCRRLPACGHLRSCPTTRLLACLAVSLSVRLSVCLPVCLVVGLSIRLFVFACVCLLVCPLFCPLVCLHAYQPVRLSVCWRASVLVFFFRAFVSVCLPKPIDCSFVHPYLAFVSVGLACSSGQFVRLSSSACLSVSH